jgi:hypothetical protein
MAKKSSKSKPGKDHLTAQLNAKVLPETKEAFERVAGEMERTVSWLINDLVKKFIVQHDAAKVVPIDAPTLQGF